MPRKPAATVGHFHVCPKVDPGPKPHVGGAVAEGSPNVHIGGLPAARKGDKAVCVGPPDTIDDGSSTVQINNLPAARMGDKTVHGGLIAQGDMTVLVGDSGGYTKVSPTAEFGSWNPVMHNAPPKHEMDCGNVTYHTDAEGAISKAGGSVADLARTPEPHAHLEPGRVCGGMTLPCGGRDSSVVCNVFKDPATAHKDGEAWRKPVVKDGVVQPLEGTNGKPKKIMSSDEAAQVATREFNGMTYKVRKDEQGFPEFTVFETYLSDEHINTCKQEPHFEAANKRLGQMLRENPTLKQHLGLTEKQVRYFTAEPPRKGSPKGLTWHHHQDVGKMQLVHESLHMRFGHVGGMQVWGGSRA